MREAQLDPHVDDALCRFLANPSSLADPFPLFHAVRNVAPVTWSSAGYWVVTGHAEATQAYRAPELSREAMSQVQFRWIGTAGDDPKTVTAVDAWLATVLTSDGARHTRLRKLTAKAFTPRAVQAWTQSAAAVSEMLIERLRDKPRFDLLAEFAEPLPEKIVHSLLGITPAESTELKAIAGGLSQAEIFTRAVSSPVPGEDVKREAQRTLLGYYEFFIKVVEQHHLRGHSALVNLLIAAEEAGQDRLSEEELLGTLILLLNAGTETTSNLIGNGMLALLTNPDEYARLRRDPELTDNAVEEFLRYDTPGRGQPRIAMNDVEIGDITVKSGEQVVLIAPAANRDPRRFPDPDRLDITRDASGHLGFGAGAHHCMGAALARMEAREAFRFLACELGELRLDQPEILYKRNHGRNLQQLLVERIAS